MDNITKLADRLIGCHNAIVDVEELISANTINDLPSPVVSLTVKDGSVDDRVASLTTTTQLLLNRIKRIREALENEYNVSEWNG